MGTPRLPALAGLVVANPAATLEIVGVVTLFVAALGVGAAVFVWARDWRRRIVEDSATEEPIETFQTMLDQGLLDRQEFERIAARLHQPPALPAVPPVSHPPSESTPDQ
jgi:hypothetical protein